MSIKWWFSRSEQQRSKSRRRSAGVMMTLAMTLGGVDENALKALEQTVQEDSTNPERYDARTGDSYEWKLHLPPSERCPQQNQTDANPQEPS